MSLYYWFMEVQVDDNDPHWILCSVPEPWDYRQAEDALQVKFHGEQPGKLKILRALDCGTAINLTEYGAACTFCADECFVNVHTNGRRISRPCPQCIGD